MNEVDNLIAELEDVVFNAKRKTFSDEISLNRQTVLAILQDLKNTIPDQLRDADYIIKNRDKIISDAEAKADAILNNASKKANRMIDESEIIRTAEREAKEIVDDAKRYLDSLEIETRRSIQDTIGTCEQTLGDTLNLLRNCREDLKGTLLKNDGYNK